MATSVTFNGATYSIPANREPRGWGTSLSAFLVDVANSSLSKAGGNFTLTADVNFGTSFGLVSKYVKYSSGTLMLNTSGVITVPNATDTLVGKATTDTLTNKTLTSPVINTPTGIVKADVGLGNVDNTSDSTKNAAAVSLTNKTIDADLNTITNIENADIKVGAAIDAAKLADGSVSNAEFQYIGGLTSNAQTQLNLKANLNSPTFTGTVAGITSTMVGLGNVTNTSDANKPVSTAQQTALDLKANLASPTFTGTVVLPTATTFTNPTIDDGATFLHETTPATPSAGRVRVYPKSDNSLYVLDSSGVETPVGSGTAAGFVNYITNADAASSTTGWSTYADAAAATPADGTGGSPNVTWTRNTVSPLRGTADFAFAKDAANRQGQGVAFAFTIATTDRSKKCQIQFDYDTSAANYVAGDLRVYVYDVTNAALITPSTVDIPRGTNTLQVSFDTTTSTSYRLIVHVASVSALAYTVDFDNFVVNAGQITQGAAVSEWQSYTPTLTGLGTTTGVEFFWKRDGSDMLVTGKFTTGTPTAVKVSIPLPSGYTIDTTKSPASFAVYGIAVTNTAGVGSKTVSLLYNSSTTLGVSFVGDSSGYVPTTTQNGDAMFGASVTAAIQNARIPIAEWAGSGTVNLGAGAQVEYASNNGSAGTAANTAYNTGMVVGPAGSNFVTVASTSATGSLNTRYLVQFQYPIQQDDEIAIEFDDGATGRFNPQSGNITVGRLQQGTSAYGIWIQQNDATSVYVCFGNKGRLATGAAFADNGGAWGDITTSKWRVRKAKAGAAVGFGMATQTASGLISSEHVSSEGDLGTVVVDSGTWVPDSKKFKFVRNGKQVTFWYRLESAAAATSLASLRFALPSECPVPAVFSTTGNNEWQMSGHATNATTAGGGLSAGVCSLFYTGGTFELYHVQTAAGSRLVMGCISFYTA